MAQDKYLTLHPNHDAVLNGGALLSDPDDILWLLATHLKHIKTPLFSSFVIVGNEDCPRAVYLYADADPLISDHPLRIINLLELEVAA